MINYSSNMDSKNLESLINIEISALTTSLESQKSLNTQILTFLKGFIGNVKVDSVFSDKVNKYVSNASSCLSKISSNISSYNTLLDLCDNIKKELSSDNKNLKELIEKYNKKLKETSTCVLKSTSEIEAFLFSTTFLDISEYVSANNTNVENKNADIIVDTSNSIKEIKDSKNGETKTELSNLSENTLKISEIDGLVTLPYKIEDLKKILEENSDLYSSYSDIILAKYTIPLRNYKFSAISRYKEAYKLVRQKEHGSRRLAFSLATELFANYNLHPAIITACNNLNELDVYLSCLEYNELEDFHFFKIIYEGLPAIKLKGKALKDIMIPKTIPQKGI